MGEIEKQIAELKSLAEMDMLPQETREEIQMAIKLAEKVKDYEPNPTETKKIEIKYVNTTEFKNPSYANEGDSGFDLRANENGVLEPMDRVLIPTGLFFELPKGYELQIRPRSGLAYKHGVTVLNSPGTVDNGYRGEIKVLLINLSKKRFSWNKGERIAQGVVSHRIGGDFGELLEVKNLDSTERGENGFGSTGTE